MEPFIAERLFDALETDPGGLDTFPLADESASFSRNLNHDIKFFCAEMITNGADDLMQIDNPDSVILVGERPSLKKLAVCVFQVDMDDISRKCSEPTGKLGIVVAVSLGLRCSMSHVVAVRRCTCCRRILLVILAEPSQKPFGGRDGSGRLA